MPLGGSFFDRSLISMGCESKTTPPPNRKSWCCAKTYLRSGETSLSVNRPSVSVVATACAYDLPAQNTVAPATGASALSTIVPLTSRTRARVITSSPASTISPTFPTNLGVSAFENPSADVSNSYCDPGHNGPETNCPFSSVIPDPAEPEIAVLSLHLDWYRKVVPSETLTPAAGSSSSLMTRTRNRTPSVESEIATGPSRSPGVMINGSLTVVGVRTQIGSVSFTATCLIVYMPLASVFWTGFLKSPSGYPARVTTFTIAPAAGLPSWSVTLITTSQAGSTLMSGKVVSAVMSSFIVGGSATSEPTCSGEGTKPLGVSLTLPYNFPGGTFTE